MPCKAFRFIPSRNLRLAFIFLSSPRNTRRERVLGVKKNKMQCKENVWTVKVARGFYWVQPEEGWGQRVGFPGGPDSDKYKAQNECEMDSMTSAELSNPRGLTVLPGRPAWVKPRAGKVNNGQSESTSQTVPARILFTDYVVSLLVQLAACGPLVQTVHYVQIVWLPNFICCVQRLKRRPNLHNILIGALDG